MFSCSLRSWREENGERDSEIFQSPSPHSPRASYAGYKKTLLLSSFLQDILGSRTLNDRVLVLLSNLNTYLQFTSREPTSAWESQLSHFEAFFRKLPSVLPENVSLLWSVGSISQYVCDGRSSFLISFTLLCGFSSILFVARFSPLSINFK